jgi:hypothetical protein
VCRGARDDAAIGRLGRQSLEQVQQQEQRGVVGCQRGIERGRFAAKGSAQNGLPQFRGSLA